MSRPLFIAGATTAGLLLLALLALALLSRQEPALLAEDTPSGVVQRFLLALEGQNLEGAFAYLTSTRQDPVYIGPGGSRQQVPRTFDDFRTDLLRSRSGERKSSTQVSLANEVVREDSAEVYVFFTVVRESAPAPFESPVSRQRGAFLLKREQGSWRILEYPYQVHGIY